MRNLLTLTLLCFTFNSLPAKDVVTNTANKRTVLELKDKSSYYKPKLMSDTLKYDIKKKKNRKIKYLTNYQNINSVKQLIGKFNGKPIFLDLWASWCDPCLEEFKYSKHVFDVLSKKKIEVVYISYDKENAMDVWKNDIIKYDLSGNHLRASQMLTDDLSMTIWGIKGGVNLPHYLFFDKNGNLINKDVTLSEVDKL